MFLVCLGYLGLNHVERRYDPGCNFIAEALDIDKGKRFAMTSTRDTHYVLARVNSYGKLDFTYNRYKSSFLKSPKHNVLFKGERAREVPNRGGVHDPLHGMILMQKSFP